MARKNQSAKPPEFNAQTPENSANIEPSIYLGPTLPDGSLVRYTVFRNGATRPHVELLIQKCPAIKALIVPVKTMAETERKLDDKSSMEYGWLVEILTTFRKGA